MALTSTSTLAFDEGEKFFVSNFAVDQVNLEREEQREEELIALIQATHGVFVDAEREIVDDVGDALHGDR